MDRTDERRRNQAPTRQGQRPARRPENPRPRQEEPVRRQREYDAQPRRREQEAVRRRAGDPQPRRREYEQRREPAAPQRRQPPQGQRQRTYEEPRRRSYEDTPARHVSPGEAARRRREQERRRELERRREQERRRRQWQQRRRNLGFLLMLVVSMIAAYCLYTPLEEQPDRMEISHVTQPTEPTPPPTEPPTEPPTLHPKVPIEVTPISSLEDLATLQVPDYVDVQIIAVDGDSRRGYKLEEINDIVLHYVGNTGTTAQQNRDWYADIYSEVSSHFVVGLQGEIIQAIPLDEKSSASNHRNRDTISIEVCHPDDTGKFADATYESVVELIAWLVKACDLEVENVIRHYEVTGKVCPKYYVENNDAWQQLLADIRARVEQ